MVIHRKNILAKDITKTVAAGDMASTAAKALIQYKDVILPV